MRPRLCRRDFARTTVNAVHAEAHKLFVLVGIPHNVIFICIPNKLIWAENKRLPVVFQHTVLARTVMKIVKRNFLPLI